MQGLCFLKTFNTFASLHVSSKMTQAQVLLFIRYQVDSCSLNHGTEQSDYFAQGQLANVPVQASEPLDEFAKGLTGFGEVFGQNPGADTELLVQEIVDWIKMGPQPQAALPPPVTTI